MNKKIILALLLIAAVVAISGCAQQGTGETTQIKNEGDVTNAVTDISSNIDDVSGILDDIDKSLG